MQGRASQGQGREGHRCSRRCSLGGETQAAGLAKAPAPWADPPGSLGVPLSLRSALLPGLHSGPAPASEPSPGKREGWEDRGGPGVDGRPLLHNLPARSRMFLGHSLVCVLGGSLRCVPGSSPFLSLAQSRQMLPWLPKTGIQLSLFPNNKNYSWKDCDHSSPGIHYELNTCHTLAH